MNQATEREGASERFYHPELDGLRFLAFLAVFLHHSAPQHAETYTRIGLPDEVAAWLSAAVRAGGLGVDFFFVLSAYLITELLLREHRRFGAIDFRSFFIRRSLRIWPLYYVFVLFAAFIIPAITDNGELSARQLTSFLLFFANWECAWHGYPESVIAPLWSVAIEEQFYLLWPMVLRVFEPRRLGWALGAMIGIAIGTRAYLVAVGSPHLGIWCNSFAHLDSIALGALLAVFLRGRALQFRIASRFVLIGLGGAGIVAVLRFIDFAAARPPAHLVWAYLVVALCCALILVGGLRPHGERARVLAHPAMVYLGRVSYGLYVFHLFGLDLARRAADGASLSPAVAGGAQVVLGLGFTVAMASMSFRFLERPFLRLKTRFAHIASRPE